jgi:hypothetical protein
MTEPYRSTGKLLEEAFGDGDHAQRQIAAEKHDVAALDAPAPRQPIEEEEKDAFDEYSRHWPSSFQIELARDHESGLDRRRAERLIRGDG